ncbi:hypothetical protein H2200_001783 [Cladophialophora chaetospira]|uniref:Uncharacterized protein n=1 Tax=Cladophialophora chaetospira TaxID=386627 RepID=A0AA38XLP1_9EURO|nr:hypothetical protein H2200_001783 [Cladophialophora chaetospira]
MLHIGGNADFYGLGVRLGLYCQWLCSIWAVYFVPEARRSIASSYAVFQGGMLVGLFVMIARAQCTYTVEVFIILQVLWTGAAFTFISHTHDDFSHNQALNRFFAVTVLASYPVAAWFFIRLNYAATRDFIDTPGGTTLYYWGPTDTNNYWFWAWVYMFAAHELVFVVVHPTGDQAKKMRQSPTAFTWRFSTNLATFGMVPLLEQMMQAFIWSVMIFGGMRMLFNLFSGITDRDVEGSEDDARGEAEGAVRSMNDKDEIYNPFESRIWKVYLQPSYQIFRWCVMAVFGICAIELSLRWNHVSGVHEINSTGQVLPLAMGLARFVWLGHAWWNRKMAKQTPQSTLPGILERGIVLQDPSGRWL